jgi:hypothetical protein
MVWRVSSDAEQGRFVAWGGDGLDADADSRRVLAGWAADRPSLPLTVTGPFHAVDGLEDEMGVFLLAIHTDAVPPPRTITGQPPKAPTVTVPAGATP